MSRRKVPAELQKKRKSLWLVEHRDKARASSLKWNHKNKEKKNKYDTLYRKENPRDPDTLKVQRHRRRALLKNAKGKFTTEEWRLLCSTYKVCLRCKKKRPLTPDHVIPLSLGGSNSISNIQPLCKPCNSSKGTKTIDYRR